MKCSKCGAELSDDTKFCSYCGHKTEVATPPPVVEETEIPPVPDEAPDVPPIPDEDSVKETSKKADTPKSLTDKMKGKASSKWSGLSTYGKVATVSIAVFVLLCLVALMAGKIAAVVIAIVQIALAVVSILMHKGVIKLDQKMLWLKWLVLAIAILFTVLNVMSYSWGRSSHGNTNSPNPDFDVSVTTEVSKTVTTPYSADECAGQDYSVIKNAFSSAGFTSVEIEKIEDLKLSDADKVNTIESVSVGGQTDFTSGQEFMPDDSVIIRYHAYAKCNVTIHVDFIPNLMFSKYNVNLLLNDIEQGTLTHGEDQDFELSVDPGEYTLTFESDESSSVKGEVALTVDCDIDASYKISCYSDKISVDTIYVDRLIELDDGEVKLDVAESEYVYKDYEEVASALKTLGFTNIKYEILYDIVLGWTDEGEVESVSIDGRTDYTKGEVFKQDVPIIITYHMKEEDDPSKPVENELTEPVETNEPFIVENITVNNNSDFATLMQISDQTDATTIKNFVNSYIGTVVEFDGCVALMMKHENYNTRFDVAMVGGDYDDERVYGPLFAFEDVNYYDMNVSGTDTVAQGMNFRIAGEIKGFSSEGGYIILEPVSMTLRKESAEKIETSNAPVESASEYERAYIRALSGYDLYYMFDTDTKSVVYFGTNDTYIERGTYDGDFSTGVTITWSHGEWTEKFTHESGSYATLIDGNGWDWEYKVCDVNEAQRILDGLQ